MRVRLGTAVAVLALLAACTGSARADWTAWYPVPAASVPATATNWGFGSPPPVTVALPQWGNPVVVEYSPFRTLLGVQIWVSGQIVASATANATVPGASYEGSGYVGASIRAYAPGTPSIDPLTPAMTAATASGAPFSFSLIGISSQALPGVNTTASNAPVDWDLAPPMVTGAGLAAWTGSGTTALPLAAMAYTTGTQSGSGNIALSGTASAEVQVRYQYGDYVTPEPGSMALLGAGMALAGFARKRRAKKA